MKTFSIFSHDINGKTFEVMVTNGIPQYLINGQIQHGIQSVTDFLIAAANVINAGDDKGIVKKRGDVSDNALENSGTDQNPTIVYSDGATNVKITNSGVGGHLEMDFGAGQKAQDEADKFYEFANDLLGTSQFDTIKTIDVKIGGLSKTVTVEQRQDDVTKVKFKATGDKKWADAYIDNLGNSFGGTKVKDGDVSETSFKAHQTKILQDGVSVDLGPHGVTGTERWTFETADDAESFYNAVKDTFSAGIDRSGYLDQVIEDLAEGLGGDQIRDGQVSMNYNADQIKFYETTDATTVVHLGSRGVGGREEYKFEDQAKALEFLDEVRDLVGVEASRGPVVDEFIYSTNGQGADIRNVIGKDDFLEWIGEQFGGQLAKDGNVSESYTGASELVNLGSEGAEVQLSRSGVSGREIWEFDDVTDAVNFQETLDYIFG
jgi:hypothetical protein